MGELGDKSEELHKNGILTNVLDGDNIRLGINSNLTFSDDDRFENVRRTAEIAKLFVECGVVTICCLVSPTVKIRKLAKNNIRVTVVTRNIHKKGLKIKTQANAGYIDIVESDIFNENKIRSLFQKADICINLIGILFEKKNVNTFLKTPDPVWTILHIKHDAYLHSC